MKTQSLKSFLLLLCLAPLSGCLIGFENKTTVSGTYVGPETMAQIKPGASAGAVVALIGEPSTRTDIGDGASIWKWAYSERKNWSGGFLFVFGTRNEHEMQSAYYVEMKNGAVVRSWRD
jgi:outer membrane protein assembly factor BamE (lipoprotein component of BamABCDE complex)